MTENQIEWSRKRDELVSAVAKLGFPKELGEQIAKQLGFSYCGTIYVHEDNDPRMAFEKVSHRI